MANRIIAPGGQDSIEEITAGVRSLDKRQIGFSEVDAAFDRAWTVLINRNPSVLKGPVIDSVVTAMGYTGVIGIGGVTVGQKAAERLMGVMAYIVDPELKPMVDGVRDSVSRAVAGEVKGVEGGSHDILRVDGGQVFSQGGARDGLRRALVNVAEFLASPPPVIEGIPDWFRVQPTSTSQELITNADATNLSQILGVMGMEGAALSLLLLKTSRNGHNLEGNRRKLLQVVVDEVGEDRARAVVKSMWSASALPTDVQTMMNRYPR